MHRLKAQRTNWEGISAEERQAINNNASAVAVLKDVHAQRPIYKGRNTQGQIEADAKDLSKAAARDSDAIVKNQGGCPESCKRHKRRNSSNDN